MKNLILKDQKKRNKHLNKELKSIFIKTELKNKKLSLKQKDKIIYNNLKTKNQSRKIQVRNRCLLTGRCHGIYSSFKLSRIKLREKLSNGELGGFIKTN
jgi:small subunit ribosomal protein S14